VRGDQFIQRFGKRAREMREVRGMTQEALAKAASLHPVAISLIEGGHRAVRLETLRRLAIALDVEPAELIPALGRPK
jgi:transcriptional regulator with XRE-family HTH domain